MEYDKRSDHIIYISNIHFYVIQVGRNPPTHPLQLTEHIGNNIPIKNVLDSEHSNDMYYLENTIIMIWSVYGGFVVFWW